MKNRFVVTACRFHLKDKNKILIMGWFWKNLINNNKLTVLLDNQPLPFTLEEKDLMITEVRKKDGNLISIQYYLWVELPDNWRSYNKLSVINSFQGKKAVSCVITSEKLQRIERKIQKYIDKGFVSENGFAISGWYIDEGNVKISFHGLDGRKYPMQVDARKRLDVLRQYPEITKDDVKGFSASYKGEVPKKIRIHLESDTKKTDFIMGLQMSGLEEKGVMLKRGFNNAKVYYHQFGVASTLKKIWSKATKRESIKYHNWYKEQCPSKSRLAVQSKQSFAYAPKISIVVPLYKTPKRYLDEMIDSVKKQSYQNWELCLSDGSGNGSPIRVILKNYEKEESRIKVVCNKKPLQISDNTNAALKLATGEYIAFADHDDLLAPNALYECIKALNANQDIDIIYTDEDKVDMKGKEHFMPHFKPDFNIDMLRSVNYISHLFVVKRQIYEKAGMLNQEYDGAQDYDFVLRCVEQTKNIKHIAKVLYHWRAHKDSTAENPESKRYAFEAGKRVLAAHYDRVGIQAEVSQAKIDGIYRSRYILTERPLVSIVIPNKDHIKDLDKCIRSLHERSAYRNIEYIIVENNSQEQETFEYYKELEQKNENAHVVVWDGTGFNYPSINNYGVKHAKGDYILFLNNDTEILHESCIDELMGYCMRDDVGAVGARLYYEDGTIQHAGVIVGLGGIAGHAFVGYPQDNPGYFGRIVMAQDYSAVTAACMMVKRTVFEEAGGFDEEYAVAFNDVDLCMKIRKAGYLIVYNPYAQLKHYESKSRGYEDTEEKVERFRSEIDLFASRWEEFLEEGDPFYSPNLTLDRNDFSINLKVKAQN